MSFYTTSDTDVLYSQFPAASGKVTLWKRSSFTSGGPDLGQMQCVLIATQSVSFSSAGPYFVTFNGTQWMSPRFESVPLYVTETTSSSKIFIALYPG